MCVVANHSKVEICIVARPWDIVRGGKSVGVILTAGLVADRGSEQAILIKSHSISRRDIPTDMCLGTARKILEPRIVPAVEGV